MSEVRPKDETDERAVILTVLDKFAHQRSGLELQDYDSFAAYRSEQRAITRDLHDARTLLAAIVWRSSIDGPALREAFRAFSGRLMWDGKTLKYCTGQYFPTEYRKAVCAVLSRALWDYWRADAPAGTENIRAHILTQAKRALPRGVYARWFKEA